MKEFQRKQRKKQMEIEVNKRLLEIDFFPESKEEYEQSVGYAVEVMPGYKRLTFEQIDDSGYICTEPFDVRMRLVECGIEALIDCDHSCSDNVLNTTQTITGMPVRGLKENY